MKLSLNLRIRNQNNNNKNQISFQSEKMIYLCSPLATGFQPTEKTPDIRTYINKNMERALKFAKMITEKGDFPVWNHSTWPKFIDDTKPGQRQFALKGCFELVKRCDALVYFCKPRGGMVKEIELAESLGIPIINAKDYRKTDVDKLVEESARYKQTKGWTA